MPKTTMMSWLTDRPARGAAITGQRRRGGGARLHRRDGMRRLMLRFRELLDVVLQPVELAP